MTSLAPRIRGVLIITCLLLGAPLASPARAALNGFEGGDGNQTAACVDGFATDWACLSQDDILLAGDTSGATDDGFAPGSKHSAPEDWEFRAGKQPEKADLVAAWTNTESAAGRTYLNLGFVRAGDTGDAYLGVELNQLDTTWTNPNGATLPCRADGDVLLSYEIKSAPIVQVYTWSGAGPAACPDGAAGTWTAAPIGGFEAAINATGPTVNTVDAARIGTTLPAMTFGEASVDLQALAGFVAQDGCSYFRQATFSTRASSSIDSTLLDVAGASEVAVRSCGPDEEDVVAPAAPALTAAGACDGTVVVGGTAEPASTVSVLDGDVLADFAVADATTGIWSLTLTDVAEGVHAYAAEATDAAGNTSERSTAVSVGLDRTAPAAPTASAAVDGRTVTVSGTAEPNTIVQVLEGDSVVGGGAANDDGTYSVALPDVAPGDHAYAVVVVDACSRTSAPAVAGASVAGDPEPTPDPTPAAAADETVANDSPVTAAASTEDPPPADAPPVLVGMGDGAEQAMAGCTGRPFIAYVTLKGVRRSVFRIDGKVHRVVGRPNEYGQFVAWVDPARLQSGKHDLTADVTFTSASRKPRTLKLRFRACGPCRSRRAFKIHVPNLHAGERAVSAVVTVNGKRTKVVKGKRLSARVDLTGLLKGRYTVVIRARTNKGRVIKQVRKFRTCGSRSKSKSKGKKT